MGKKTISFVATEELADWIEEEADRRMTTISSAAQQLLAEKYRAEHELEEPGDDEPADDEPADDDLPEPFQLCPDKWWRPDSEKHKFAVRQPTDGTGRYYKTERGAAEALERWYLD